MQKKYFLFLAFHFCVSTLVFTQEVVITYNWEGLADNEQKVDSLIEASWTAFLKSDPEAATAYAERGIELATRLNYPLGLASSFIHTALVAHHLDGNFEKAEINYKKALEIRKAEGELELAVKVYINLIGLYNKQSKFEEATEVGQKGIILLEQTNKKAEVYLKLKAKLYNLLGDTYRNQTQPRKAIEYLEESLAIRKELGKKSPIMKTLLNLGNLYAEDYINNFEKANDSYEKCRLLAQEIGDNIHEARALLGLGNLYYLKNDTTSLAYYEEVRKIELAAHSDDKRKATKNLGSLYMRQDKPQKALKEWLKIEPDFRANDNKLELALISADIGEAYRKKGDYDKAIIYLNRALTMADTLNNANVTTLTLTNMVAYYSELRDYEQAYLLNNRAKLIQDSIARLAQEAIVYKSNIEETRREKAELENEQQRLKNQNMTQAGLLLISLLSILMGLVAFYAYANRKNRQLALQQVDKLLYEQELRLATARLEGRDIERERVAHDLHDRLGGMLTAVKYYFAAIEPKLNSIQNDTRTQYLKAVNLLDDSCQEVRRIAHDMTSKNLEEYGLKYTLEQFATQLQAAGKVKVDTSIFGMEERLDSNVEEQIYRIVQELMGNALKHAKAKNISIQLNHFDEIVNLMLEDDGVGFDAVTARKASKGLGLKSINKRITDLNGTWNIDSTIGRGTSVSIDIPV